MAYDIGPRIGIDGEQEFRTAIQNVNQQVRTLSSEMEVMASRFENSDDAEQELRRQTELLNKQIEAQEEKIRLLNQGLERSADKYGDADAKTLKWKETVNKATVDLNKMTGRLDDAEKALDDLKDSARKAADGIQDVRDESGKLDVDPIASLQKNFSDLKNVLVGGAVVTGIKEVAGALIEVVDGTEEYRKIMGTLEASSQAAGYTSEETAEAYDRLYGVLGDTQTAATTVANLQALGLEQEKLMQLVDVAIGGWATYGDSIPIDALAESINETVKTGEVTGALADVLNWGAEEGETYGVALKEANEANKEWNDAVNDAKSAEDYFNLAMQDTQTEAERVDKLLAATAKQGLKEQSDAWHDLNEDIVNSNTARADFEEAMGELGETLAPIKDGLMKFAAEGIGAITDAIGWAIDGVRKLIGWLNDLSKKDRETYGSGVDARGEGRAIAPQSVNGSYATGLYEVPYDGFTARMHKDEMIVPASMAERMRSGNTGGFAALAESMVNGVQTAVAGSSGGSYTFNLVMPDNTVLARYQLPALIEVARANGTPILNPINA